MEANGRGTRGCADVVVRMNFRVRPVTEFELVDL